ncbi:MAG: hypothetical protein JW725_05590, partial [Candidatus Babeliaceae bacterium]|nr:hypothetical protein [Candidatus Babeliaceae bacterium]
MNTPSINQKILYKPAIAKLFLIVGLFLLAGQLDIFGQVETGTVTICGGSSTIGSNDGPNTGTWSVFQGTGTFADNNKTTVVTGSSFGTNIYRYTITGVVTKEWTVINYRSYAGTDIISCSNVASIQLNSSNPASAPGSSGTWTCVSANCGSISITNPNQYNT